MEEQTKHVIIPLHTSHENLAELLARQFRIHMQVLSLAALDHYPALESLTLIAHSTKIADKTFISAEQTLSPQALVDILMKIKLPPTVKNIYLFACEAGFTIYRMSFSDRAIYSYNDFTEKFAVALHKAGYENINVKAFTNFKFKSTEIPIAQAVVISAKEDNSNEPISSSVHVLNFKNQEEENLYENSLEEKLSIAYNINKLNYEIIDLKKRLQYAPVNPPKFGEVKSRE